MSRDVRTLTLADVELIYLAASALHEALATMKEGADLPDDDRQKHGLATLTETVGAYYRCRLSLAQLDAEGGIRHAGKIDERGPNGENYALLFRAIARLRDGVASLQEIFTAHAPTKKVTYPHLPPRDWVRHVPPGAVLAIKQAVEKLDEFGSGLTEGRAPATTKPNPRDKFIYDKMTKGESLAKIKNQVNRRNGWEPIETEAGVSQAAMRYAKKHRLQWPLR